MQTSVTGYPRIGAHRELKFHTEAFFRGEITEEELIQTGQAIRLANWKTQQAARIDFIPSNDFSFYDNMLDTAVLFGAIPQRYRDAGLSGLGTYFAMARGHQDKAKGIDLKALSMRKWFNTNYHYMVPELDSNIRFGLSGTKPIDEFREAQAAGINTIPTVIGPFTFLKLAHYSEGVRPQDFAESAARAWGDMLSSLAAAGCKTVRLDEPVLVTDLDAADIGLFTGMYRQLLGTNETAGANGTTESKRPAVLLNTAFGDVRDIYRELVDLPFAGIALDFIEGQENLRLVRDYGFPADKLLIAGIVNGRNVWRNDREKSLAALQTLFSYTRAEIVVGTSCSLLHVPVALSSETALPADVVSRLAFAEEKLVELGSFRNAEINGSQNQGADAATQATSFENPCTKSHDGKSSDECIRRPARAERKKIQQQRFAFPFLPTTTIGSFPQTHEVQANRARFRKREISKEEYEDNIKKMIADCIAFQEDVGLDVLVHGEFERNDMVEFFGENLTGFVFTKMAWVQSYGTRCVKPPIIVSDVSRSRPMTVPFSVYAQSLTKKPVKGMLTGPVTILNWSFPREDIPPAEIAFQIARALRDEVLDLEKSGIRIIQIDEAALKEKLPLRRADWHRAYLDWAIPAFRLVHSGVRPETQIHTHMCYSEFGEIIADIDAMDADVISFEAARSNLEILDALKANHFETAVGPGVYDIHSPRVPSVSEIESAIRKMLSKLSSREKSSPQNDDRIPDIWVNPDCGLKTRGPEETEASLKNMIEAVKRIRGEKR